MTTIRTRFAPSPTGYLHIGGARTALFSWLYARRYQGAFVLRIEDTDRERSTEEAVRAILDGLEWLDLDHDEGPFFQTGRFARYREVIDDLLARGLAYRCYCSRERLETLRAEQTARKEKPRYDGRCRRAAEGRPSHEATPPVVRFKNPQDGEVVVEDLIRGRVAFRNRELDDLILLRSDGTPTYNLSVVVDDLDMGITHVIRGDDHLNNTPRQINVFRALEATVPAFAHLPMILGPDGKPLSKRHGAVSVLQYRDDGYLPQALLNYLARLGWSHGDQEVFSTKELIEKFEIAEVNKAAATFDPQKLLWLNQHYMKHGDIDDLLRRLRVFQERAGIEPKGWPALAEVMEPLRERSKTLVEMAAQTRLFYQDLGDYDPAAAEQYLSAEIHGPLVALREGLTGLPKWDPESIHAAISNVAAGHALKFGQLAQPLRVAVSGTMVSPPIDQTVALLGREQCLARIDRALCYIGHGHGSPPQIASSSGRG
ncbi:MAG: glutamate--tRNA ligase [Gammaproteobacteria bacterium]